MHASARRVAKTSISVVAIACALALASMVFVMVLQHRADQSREAQITLGVVAREFDALQSVPYDVLYADDEAGRARVAARMRASERRIESQLATLARSAPSGDLHRVMTPYRANVATLERIRVLEGDGRVKDADALGLVASHQQARVGRHLRGADADYRARARKSLMLATAGSAGTIAALVGLFAVFYLRSRRGHAVAEALADENARLLVEDSQLQVVQRLALAAEYRDDDTGQHTARVADLSMRIGAALGMPEGELELLRRAAPLHDVGKIAVPDHILLKPGRLSREEFEHMKTHTTLGAEMLARPGFPLLEMAEQVALTHHERWDGTGYPAGLSGPAIPLVGRIVAVADVFDALTNERPYKDAWPAADAIAEITAQSNRQFDPKVVAAFLMVLPDVLGDLPPADPRVGAGASPLEDAQPYGPSGASPRAVTR